MGSQRLRCGGLAFWGAPDQPVNWLQETQFAGAGDGLGAPMNPKFAEDLAIVPFDGVEGEEKALANFAVG